MHILTRLIREAEYAQKIAESKPPYLPHGYLNSNDIEELKQVRLIYFTDRVRSIRRLMLGKFVSEHSRRNCVREEINKLNEDLGLAHLPVTFRADVLDDDRNATELVKLWFLERQEA